MAKPMTQVELRLERHEKAIRTMAFWLSQTPDSFGVKDVEGIEKILRGEKDERLEGSDDHSNSERQDES